MQEIHLKYNFNSNDIYNAYETGCNVQKVGTIKVTVCIKDKQVGKNTSTDRGNLVTMLAAVNAFEHVIPTFMLFPTVHFKALMLHDVLSGQLTCQVR